MSKTKKEIFEELLAKEPTEENALKSVDFAIKHMNYNKFMIQTKSGTTKDFYILCGIILILGLISLSMFIYLMLNLNMNNKTGFI